MGTGIAVAFANAGGHVRVVDANAEALGRAGATIEQMYRRAVERGSLSAAAAAERLRCISLGTELAALADSELLVEAVFENLAVKADIFAEVGRIIGSEAILATNTSTLDVDAIVAAAPFPERSLGMHFFSPAHLMKLVEVVRATRTSSGTIGRVVAIAKSIGKIPIVVGNGDGFVGNRMLLRYRREAELLLEAGATPQQVDHAMREFGFALGPFAVSDLAGLDIAYSAKQERMRRGGLPFRQSRVPDLLVEAGRLGQKSGAGYYRYERGSRTPIVDPAVGEIVAAERERLAIVPRTVDDGEIVGRTTLALFNEGARILRDGVAASSADIDAIWVNGYGFPAARGGPMAYAASLGADAVMATIARFAQDDPAFWASDVAEAVLHRRTTLPPPRRRTS